MILLLANALRANERRPNLARRTLPAEPCAYEAQPTRRRVARLKNTV